MSKKSPAPLAVRQQTQIHQASLEMKSFRGPLPAPEDLKAYQEVSPDAVATILDMAKKEQEHRHEQERALVIQDHQIACENIVTERRGQFGAGYAVTAMSAVAAYALYLGYPNHGITVVGTLLLSLVGAFLGGRYSKVPEQPKPPQLPPKEQ